MIISDKYGFVFIHIPKCAGKSVKKYLNEYDEYPQFSIPGSMLERKTLGKIDLTHMPLQVVKENFPNEFEKITHYETFAIIRDPYARFRSSVSEYLRLYKKANMAQLSSTELTNYLIEIMSILQNYSECLIGNYKFIHFERQINYVKLDDRMIVHKIYLLDDINAFVQDISKLTGKQIEMNNEGQTIYSRNEFTRIILTYFKPLIGDFLNKVLTERFKNYLRKLFYTNKVKSDFDEVFNSKKVKDFVSRFYKEDLELYLEYLHQKKNYQGNK